MTTPLPPSLPSRGQLLKATTAAAMVASLVLVVAVLPAEYGVDPTGMGDLLGLTPLAGTSGESGGGGPLAPSTGRLTDEVYAFEARWTLHERPLLANEGYVTVEQTEERLEIPVNLSNVTSLNAVLTWVDEEPGTAPDLFELSVRAPDGRASQRVSGENPQGGEGRVSASLNWRSIPFPKAGNGSQVTFDKGPPDTSARGNWTVVVRLYRTGGTGTTPDAGNGYRLTVTAETYALVLKAKADRAPGDTVTLSLPPNGHLEYKLQMADGAEMEYSWKATGPVYYDFHGDPIPPRGNEFTSYRETTAAADEGVFKAPFNGRHGWFWWNKGTEPVTLTLQTTGDYQVIGVV